MALTAMRPGLLAIKVLATTATIRLLLLRAGLEVEAGLVSETAAAHMAGSPLRIDTAVRGDRKQNSFKPDPESPGSDE